MTRHATLTFTIEHPNGSKELLSVDSDNVVVGSGAHCEIRLAGEEIPTEQVSVESRGAGVFAEARCMDPPALLNGLPFAQGRLLPETSLQIGRFSVRVEHTASVDSPIVARASKQQTNPLVLVMAAVGFPLGFYLLFALEQPVTGLGSPPEAPPLWQDIEVADCIHDEAAVAEAQAAAYLATANVKRERSPFSPEDGVNAVTLYAKASRCYSKAGSLAEAEAATAAAVQMRQAVSRQFHVHQVRLERALAMEEYEAATTEARLLQSFVGRAGGEYHGWLSDLQRGIKARFSGRQ